MPYEKVGAQEPICIADEVPFEIPDSWAWVRIKSLGEIVRGSGIKRTETASQGEPCVRYGELYTTYTTFFTEAVSFIPPYLDEKCKHFTAGDILMTLTGENKPDIAKAVAYLGDKRIAAGGDLAYWSQHGMNPLYLAYLLAAPYVIGKKVELATGDIIVHISGEKLGAIVIPIPPIIEQNRIVTAIQTAEAVLAEYEQKEHALTQLHKTFPEQLRKSILQMTVQGKLVLQDQNDEPASVLLECIRAEKAQLIKEGKIKRDKHESIIYRRDNSHYELVDGIERCIDDEIPFEIPETWAWVRLKGLLSALSTGPFGSMLHKSDYSDDGIPIINPADIMQGQIVYNRIKRVNIDKAKTMKQYALVLDDVIIGRRGEMGRSAVVKKENESCLCGTGCFFVHPNNALSSEYLVFLLMSPMIKAALLGSAVGTTMNNLNHEILCQLLIPLPPHNEQKRIIEAYLKVASIIQ